MIFDRIPKMLLFHEHSELPDAASAAHANQAVGYDAVCSDGHHSLRHIAAAR